jgi:hypothetical protein
MMEHMEKEKSNTAFALSLLEIGSSHAGGSKATNKTPMTVEVGGRLWHQLEDLILNAREWVTHLSEHRAYRNTFGDEQSGIPSLLASSPRFTDDGVVVDNEGLVTSETLPF